MKILDRNYERDGALGVLEAIEQLGLTPAEAIPAMMRATVRIATQMEAGGQALDEAVDLLDEEVEP